MIRLLADQMGLGKTWIALHLIPKGWGAILTGPVNAKEVWAQHVGMLRPEMTVKKLKARKDFDLPVSNEAVIGNYEQMWGAIGCLVKYHPNKIVLIIDEIHLIKNPTAKRTKDIRKLAENILEHGGLVYGLTGTPVLNGESIEIWNHLVTLGVQLFAFPQGFPEMGKLGGMRKVTVPKGRGGHVDTWKQVRDPEPEFAERLRRVMLRRTRKDVFASTPDKVYHKITMPLEGAKGKELRALLDSLRRDLVRYGDRDILDVMGDPLILETISIIRKASADLKITAMLQWIGDHEESFPRVGDSYPEPLLVASAHWEPIDFLRRLPGWRVITGEVKSEERGEIAQEFRDGKLAGVGFTIAAGGEGINLCREGARRMLFVDCDWRPGKMSQAEDRLRPHQLKESCEYSYLVLDHPLEVKVWETLMRKKEYNEKVGLGEDGGTVEAKRLPKVKAVKAIEGGPYYRGSVVGDYLEFVCQRRNLIKSRYGIKGEWEMANDFFKAVGCQWKPRNLKPMDPENARWVVRVDKLAKINWKDQMPDCIELDPASEMKLKPTPRNISYPPIAKGTRQYQLEAIIMMREES